MASVLICALSSSGAARAFVSIAETLLSRGHDVTVLSAPDAEPHYRGLPLRFVPVDEPGPGSDPPAPAPTSRALRAKQSFADDRRRYFTPIPQQWEAVQQQIRRARVDAVLTESLFAGAMALSYLPRAERPLVVGIGTVPPIAPDPAVPPYGLGIAPQDHPPGRLVTAALELAASRAYTAAGIAFQDEVERLTGRRPHPDVRRIPTQQDVFAQLTVQRFEYPRAALPANFRFIGPLRPIESGEIPLWWDPRREPPVVAVEATADRHPADLILPTIEAFGGDDVTVLVSGADRQVVETAYGRPLPANVHFEWNMPWSRLLFGRSVLVTAGDYIPVHAALRSGTPVIAAPDSGIRVETAARVEWSGAGINLRTASTDATAVRNAVLRARADPEIQHAVARIAARIAASDAEGELADIVESAIAARDREQAHSKSFDPHEGRTMSPSAT